MKKKYIIPLTETNEIKLQKVMQSTSLIKSNEITIDDNDAVLSRENNYIQPHSVWED